MEYLSEEYAQGVQARVADQRVVGDILLVVEGERAVAQRRPVRPGDERCDSYKRNRERAVEEKRTLKRQRKQEKREAERNGEPWPSSPSLDSTEHESQAVESEAVESPALEPPAEVG